MMDTTNENKIDDKITKYKRLYNYTIINYDKFKNTYCAQNNNLCIPESGTFKNENEVINYLCVNMSEVLIFNEIFEEFTNIEYYLNKLYDTIHNKEIKNKETQEIEIKYEEQIKLIHSKINESDSKTCKNNLIQMDLIKKLQIENEDKNKFFHDKINSYECKTNMLLAKIIINTDNINKINELIIENKQLNYYDELQNEIKKHNLKLKEIYLSYEKRIQNMQIEIKHSTKLYHTQLFYEYVEKNKIAYDENITLFKDFQENVNNSIQDKMSNYEEKFDKICLNNDKEILKFKSLEQKLKDIHIKNKKIIDDYFEKNNNILFSKINELKIDNVRQIEEIQLKYNELNDTLINKLNIHENKIHEINANNKILIRIIIYIYSFIFILFYLITNFKF